MAERICSIPDCDRPVSNRGWCNAHYLRWWRHADPLGGRRSPVTAFVERACSVDGCNRPHDSRGLCSAHYQRLLKSGNAGAADIEVKRKDAVCSVDGCERRYYGKGYCTLHYQRWWKYGDPSIVLPSSSKGDDVGYSAVHERLNRTRGHASTHPCQHCGQPAVDWAYDHTCPNERVGMRHGQLLAYSTNPDRYLTLCRACHSRHDDNLPRKTDASG